MSTIDTGLSTVDKTTVTEATANTSMVSEGTVNENIAGSMRSSKVSL